MKIVLHNKRGVAIMLVLGMTVLLSGLVARFAFDSRIKGKLAQSSHVRLQAEYLARSGYQFMRLQLAREPAIKQLISQISGGAVDLSVPLCSQFPMNSALLRSQFGLSVTGEDVSDEVETEGVVTGAEQSVIQDFLTFSGDFDALCQDESSKINLNVYADHDPSKKALSGLNTYDRHKATLINFFSLPPVMKLFGDKPEEQLALAARNIADWVDTNDRINQAPGAQGGGERSEYDESPEGFTIRNGKMVSLDEAFLISGVDDAWFTPLRDYLTIYGDGKINVCTADRLVIEALIMSYAAHNPRIPQINPKNRELIDTVVGQIAADCGGQKPSVATITKNVEALLVAGGGVTNNTAGGAGGGLGDLITIESKLFRIRSIGTVPMGRNRELSVRLDVVLDTSDKDPKKWKTLYWSMQ